MIRGKADDRGLPIEVKLMQSHSHAMALRGSGAKPVSPAVVHAIIDTGAGISVIDQHLAAGLGLKAHDLVAVHTPTTEGDCEWREVVDATIVIGEQTGKPLTLTLRFVSGSLARQQFFALIGRDILDLCQLHYDGPNQAFSLSWD